VKLASLHNARNHRAQAQRIREFDSDQFDSEDIEIGGSTDSNSPEIKERDHLKAPKKSKRKMGLTD